MPYAIYFILYTIYMEYIYYEAWSYKKKKHTKIKAYKNVV